MLNFRLTAQIHNALSFDGVDDKVTVANGSSLIANSTNLSLTVWANPDSTNVPFPDLNGFAGFRNDNNADFYLVHIYAGQLEGRLTNSSGTSYTLTINGVQGQVWQHFALTYDGSYLRIYANGYIADSIAASGSISSTNQPFNVGFLPYQTSPFYTQGKIDEVTLWNKTLTETEIGCIKQFGAPLSDPALKLAFNCNQGTAGGNNASINSLNDASGHINGVFTNMPRTGIISNFVTGPLEGHTSIAGSICPGDSFLFNGQYYHTPGNFSAELPAAGGCDSIVVATLDGPTYNTNVLVNGNILASLETVAAHQWIDCSNNSPIPNATGQFYTATSSGNFAVVLSSGGCSDTSACYTVTVGVNEFINDVALRLYPNPVKNNLHLAFEKAIEHATVNLFSMDGRLLLTEAFNNQKELQIDTRNLVSGLYMLNIETSIGKAVKLFEKAD